MKKILLLTSLICAISFFSCSKDKNSEDDFTGIVTVTQKGTLQSLLQKYSLMDASKLTIVGTLGESDFQTFKELIWLDSLDLSGVKISVLPAYAFYGCHLKSIILPENLEEIGLAALESNPITIITIPPSVRTIGERAFAHCKDLKTVYLSPNSQLKTIMGNQTSSENTGGAFMNCKALTSINIPASVETIGFWAFEFCSALHTITFQPNSKLKIMDGAFWSCTSLTSIEIPSSIENLDATFVNCTSLKTVRFQTDSQLKTIKASTFHNCPLETFDATNCLHLTSISMISCTVNLFKLGTKTPPYCDFSVVDNATLQVPQGSVNAYKNADGWKNFTYIYSL